MKKVAADLIATEMFRLLKKAQDDTAGTLPADNTSCADDDSADDAAMDEDEAWDDAQDEDMAEDDLQSFLMNHADDDGGDESSYVDDEIDAMENMANDDLMNMGGSYQSQQDDSLMAKASDIRLMSGLGRIEASLRNKGEGFAADLVRATASSIKEDIVKEASQRNYVVKNLVKMASDLDRKGDRDAARMVKSTIMKINR